MAEQPQPTGRELEILKILWRRNEATVRQVYEEMRQTTPIVQNTVQAFLRTMEEKGLLEHRRDGRSFVYRPVLRREQTTRRMAQGLLERVFDGAIDQLVDSLFSQRPPSEEELNRLEALISRARATTGKKTNKRGRRS